MYERARLEGAYEYAIGLEAAVGSASKIRRSEVLKQYRESGDILEFGCVSTDIKEGNWLYEDSDAGMSLHLGLSDD